MGEIRIQRLRIESDTCLSGSNLSLSGGFRIITRTRSRTRVVKKLLSVLCELGLRKEEKTGGGGVNMLASHLLCESDKVQLFSFSMRTLVS